jgi:Carboxypeptidase regulatory-like domain
MSVKTLLLMLFAIPAMAQVAGGTLSGRVVDRDGNAVARLEAAVTLTDAATGKSFVGHLSRDGQYKVEGLPAATYDLDLTVPSRIYEPYSRKAVVIRATESVLLELRLDWGMNLGTIGDDPLLQGSDLRAKTRNVNGPAPRTPAGRPDLSGVWINFGDSYAGAVPMQPWAQTMFDEVRKIRQDTPGAYCLPQSGLMTTTNYPYKFVQTPTLVVQLIEDMVISHRQIYLDGRGHPDPDAWNPSWFGHSIGRWEGDTLVVETTGFNEVTPGFGIHTESLAVTEKYTRRSYGLLDIEITAVDKDAWTGPWQRSIRAGLAEGTEIVEFVCAEGAPAHAALRAPWKARP